MTVTAAALRELHRVHLQLSELQDRLERGPKQVRAREANLAQLEAALATARENDQKLRMAVDQKQLDLRTGEQKIVDLRAKLNAAASNKEYQALLEQIAASEMANSVLADEILEGLEKVDELAGSVKEAEQQVEAAQRELKKARQDVEQTATSIREDIARLEGELAAAERGLPADFKRDYNRIVASKGADGLTVVDDGVCTGCGRQITLNMQSELQLSRPVFCKACGRLLYLPEV